MKKMLKCVMAFALAALTLLGVTACGKVEMPQGIKEYLCVEHEFGGGLIERRATCLREGKMLYTCALCGYEKEEKLAKVGHTAYAVPAQEATCAQAGYTKHTVCVTCGVVLAGKETIEKLACDHTNDVYEGMGVYACSLCGEERMEYVEEAVAVGDSIKHSWYRFYNRSGGFMLLESVTCEVSMSSGTIIYENDVVLEFLDTGEMQISYGAAFCVTVTNATTEKGSDYIDVYLKKDFTYIGIDDEFAVYLTMNDSTKICSLPSSERIVLLKDKAGI